MFLCGQRNVLCGRAKGTMVVVNGAESLKKRIKQFNNSIKNDNKLLQYVHAQLLCTRSSYPLMLLYNILSVDCC